MDANTPLTKTTLERSLNTLHLALTQALERGKTIEQDEVEGYLLDTSFSVAVFAGWIDAPTSPLEAELQYTLKPQFRNANPPPTVILGGLRVTEEVHDKFISLFWFNQQERWAKKAQDIEDSVIALLESGVDTLADIRVGSASEKNEGRKKTASSLPDANARRTPAQVMIDGKTDLGITWDKLRAKASEQLQIMADEENKAISKMEGRIKVQLQVDSIYRLLRGRNIRPDNAKAIAAVIGVDWKLLVWPTKAKRRKFKQNSSKVQYRS